MNCIPALGNVLGRHEVGITKAILLSNRARQKSKGSRGTDLIVHKACPPSRLFEPWEPKTFYHRSNQCKLVFLIFQLKANWYIHSLQYIIGIRHGVRIKKPSKKCQLSERKRRTSLEDRRWISSHLFLPSSFLKSDGWIFWEEAYRDGWRDNYFLD